MELDAFKQQINKKNTSALILKSSRFVLFHIYKTNNFLEYKVQVFYLYFCFYVIVFIYTNKYNHKIFLWILFAIYFKQNKLKLNINYKEKYKL